MSIKLVSSEISRFLGSAEPEVLCITGRWGVGKTFAWNRYLRQAQEDKNVKLERYSYVSMFGRNSLDDVRTAIVENTVDSRVVGTKPDLTSFKSIAEQLRSRIKNIPWLAGFVPSAAGYASSAYRVLFLTLKDQIVCIDDLERADSGLGTMNILGLVTSLKVEKSCKVIIILNEEGLSGPDKEDFKTQLEKVADTIVSFEPTPEEAAEIGIDKSSAFHARLAKNTQALGIVNIRVIKKIETLCCRLHDIVAKRDTRVLDQAVHTIALAGYAKFQPNDAPPLEFIRTYNRLQAIIGRPRNEADDPTHRHRALLVSYDFNTPDEFDAVIIEGVERGLFDEAAVQQRADDLQERLRREDKNSSFKQAWMRFYGSFSNDQDTILDELNESVKSNVEVITPAELDRTVAVLKEFGRAGQAKEALQFYIDSRQEKAEFWNLLGDPLRATVADPDVRASFSAKFSAMTTTRDTKQILKHVAERDSWSPEELAHLASQTEAEYIAILKQLSGEELVSAVRGALRFRMISNADENMKTITRTVEGALRQIAAENPMNARRVRDYGVQVDVPRMMNDTSKAAL